jgi:alpha-N-arabinofuranosidase
MNSKNAILTGSLISCLPLLGDTIKVTVDDQADTHQISRYLYGQFIEHLGGCIYDGIWVGEDSAIPNDRGIRLDTVEALKKLNIPVMRWPGGLFADTYHWRDGIGPREQRPITLNRGWNSTESNQFGTHEFMDFCELIGTEPYICINIGSGTVEEARSWAEYCNSEFDTTLTRERAKTATRNRSTSSSGRLGNEPYYALDGNMTPKYYYERARHFAPYVKFTAANVTLATEPGYDDVKIFLADGSVVEKVDVRERDQAALRHAGRA